MDSIQKIYSYVAMCGLPFWGAYFYVIDIGKNNYLIDLLNKGLYDEAEKYLISNKFMADFFDNGALRPENCASFGRYDWSEYCKCYADACFRYILGFYVAKEMNERHSALYKKPRWWGESMHVRDSLNDLVLHWRENIGKYPRENMLVFSQKEGDYPKINLEKVLQMFEPLQSLHIDEIKKGILKTGLFIETLYNEHDIKALLKETNCAVNEFMLTAGLAYNYHLDVVKNQNVLCFKENK